MCPPIVTEAPATSQAVQLREDEQAAEDRPIIPSHEEPYLVVRIMATVYQREPLTVVIGTQPYAKIGHGCCLVVHPRAWDDRGLLTSECRSFLVAAVLKAVTTTGFRMCLVWSASSCTFVELDGSTKDSSEPPSGGFPIPFKIAFDERVPLNPGRGGA